MSTTPVTLDFSKAQPIDSGGVQLDFSKAQPLSTDQALSQAAATVAKPNPKTDANGVVDPNTGIDPVERVRDFPNKIISAISPKDMPPPAKGFGAEYDPDIRGIRYTYPPGQHQLSKDHPETSYDDEGNIYFQGNKVDQKIGIAFPTPGVGLPTVGAAVSGVKSAAQTGVGLAKATLQWISNNPIKAYLLFKVASEAGLGHGTINKILHLAGESGE